MLKNSTNCNIGIEVLKINWLFLFFVLIMVSCKSKEEDQTFIQTGKASFYHHQLAGEATASGEAYDPASLTAAHQSLPLGTKVEVTNLENGQSTVVTINDRGPFVGNRIIDLSRAAAESLGMVEDGVVQVQIEVVEPADGYTMADSVAWRTNVQ